MLFPFVIAMLYGSAVYGLTFFAQYQMQDAVDTAVSTALYLDRSNTESGELATAVTQRANSTLAALVGELPERWKGNLNTNSACGLETIAGGVEVLHCSLVYPNYQANPIVPVLSFGILGDFPPLPATLSVDARAAF